MSAIDSASKMNNHHVTQNTNRSRLENDIAIKEMSHFGGSLQSQSLYSTAPAHQLGNENNTLPSGAPRIKLKFNAPRIYESNVHQDVLAMAKPEYHGKDFFQRKEFRGLLLADYQEAIGEKAFACVDQLNTNTVS